MRRERHNLSMLIAFTSSARQPNQRAAPVSAQIRLASPSSESRLSRSETGTQLTAFSQIPKSSAHASGAWRHSHPLVTIPICDFYFDISEWHILSTCVWTPALMLHLTNPCAKQKVLILTKPKGKIYKTKSFHNYITYCSKRNGCVNFAGLYIYIYIYKVGDCSRGWPECSLFNSYYTEVCVWGGLLHSLDCSTLPLILTL